MSDWDRQITPGGAEGPQWVSAADAADAAGVTPGTVRYWARNGLIVSEVVPGPTGERTLVRLDEVLQHARGGATGEPEGARRDVVTDLPARTTELAPILKSIPDLMAQLTAATDRAARAETKVEFLSAQLADARRRLAEAEAREAAPSGAPPLTDVWESPAAAEDHEPDATSAGAPGSSGWPAPPPDAIDWSEGSASGRPSAPADQPPAAQDASRLSLRELWDEPAPAPAPAPDPLPSTEPTDGVEWHEPARPPSGLSGSSDQASAPSRPANATLPDDGLDRPRRRRRFRRRR